MAHWAHAPATSEETLFNRFATERLGLPADQLPAFRRLCLLSAEAVWRWKRGTNNGLTAGWSRDHYYTFPNLPATASARAIVLTSQDEAVTRFEEIVALARTLTPADPADREFILSSSLYGLRLLRILRAVVYLKTAELDADGFRTKAWLDRHDEAWADYLALAQEYPDSISTFYVRNAWQTWGGENPTTAEPRLRTVAQNTLAAYQAADRDADGLSDADELGRFWDQPFDSDRDGTPDYLQSNSHPRAFDHWRQEKFLRAYDDPTLAAPSATPAADGLPNLVKYALDLDPLTPAPGHLRPELSPANSALRLEFSPNPATTDLILEVHASDDLVNWSTVARSTAGAPLAPLAPGWTVAPGTAPGALRLESPATAPAARRFLRLSAEPTPP
jgi:hypothetical protein